MKGFFIALIFLFLINPLLAQHYDWPMWRYDFNRSASTPEQLPGKLYLQWQLKYSARTPVWDDPLNRNLMKYDRVFEPVVADNKIFIGFNDQDKVLALDINSGKELWHFYTDGPVRLPLAIHNSRIYFTSDDGYCYCLNTGDGTLVWKRLLAPAKNKLLGNKRLISMWPARGGIVIKNDIVYTAASIFPLMGTYIYALDAVSGEIIWKNEGTGSNYILQPHNTPAFADVAPQGAFTISGDKLLVAAGRSVPAAFDLKTGEELYYHLAASKKTGGAFTCANNKVFFNHHRERMTNMYASESGKKLLAEAGEYPVIDGDTFYFSGAKIVAAKLHADSSLDSLWTLETAATKELIKAGDCLFAADSLGIKAISLAIKNEPKVIWDYKTEENIERLVVSNGKLIAVTAKGSLMVFGNKPVPKVATINPKVKAQKTKASKKTKAINTSGIKEGYCLVFGGEDVALLEYLVKNTRLHMVVYENDRRKVEKLRGYFDAQGISADRLSFQYFDEGFPMLPKYFSSLTVVNDLAYTYKGDDKILRKIYESTRPYGGKVIFMGKGKKQDSLWEKLDTLALPGAICSKRQEFCMITRSGALEGSAPWTHNYGDIANTVKSDDKLVKAPLGILWFGGNSNLDVLPRHGHGPGEQVINGRLIIQGMNCISARDVYTGRVLWKREFEQLLDDNWLVYYDESYDGENPLDTKYNQVHLPGSNSRGTNFIATKEYIYLIEKDKCNVIDINTGEIVKVFKSDDNNTSRLGYIGVYKDLLLLGNNFAHFPGLNLDSIPAKKQKFADFDLTASRELMVLDRFSGKKLWKIEANHGIIHNSVVAGDDIIFCLDKLPQYIETKMKRRGESIPKGSRLLYLDAQTGKVIHEETNDIFGTWLGYSDEHKLLLQATRPSRDMLTGEVGNRMIAYNINSKEKIWDKPVQYANPPIIHNENIYTNGKGFKLLTGEPLTETDPVTGEELKWGFKREYGCGIVAASEHLLTFRSASAGFVNLNSNDGTANLGGWKASCSTNLIAADGVLNSPDYTRTCQCAYQNQTSLALVNMPWMTYWTNSNYSWNGKQINQLGINFNAPGDRSANNNVLWFEYPFVAGRPPGIPVESDSVGVYKIRKEPLGINSDETPWVSASALGGMNFVEIMLSNEETVSDASYTVKLYFAELEDKLPGERIFDISIQGKEVTRNFDIMGETGKADTEIVKTYAGIQAGRTLKIELLPVKGHTIISGVEIIQEK